LHPGAARRMVPAWRNLLPKFSCIRCFQPRTDGPFSTIEDFAKNCGILANLSCQPIIVGGVEDHVHLLCALARTCTASDMVKEAKRGSSLWIKTKDASLQDFSQQNGFGIFSIGYSQIPDAKQYIASQEEHHRKTSFQDEYRTFLERYEIAYDERYVWD
jgi:hypothetical protein